MSFIFQGAIKTSNVIFELDEIKFSCFTILNKQEVSENVEQRADPEMKKKRFLMYQFELDLLFFSPPGVELSERSRR